MFCTVADILKELRGYCIFWRASNTLLWKVAYQWHNPKNEEWFWKLHRVFFIKSDSTVPLV